jgi:hypothetical protein
MPSIGVTVDGHRVGAVAGQLSGNSLITAPAPPLRVYLHMGRHTLQIHRAAPTLAPGDRGRAVLTGVFLSPPGNPEGGALVSVRAGGWPALCPQRLEWVEADHSAGAGRAAISG